MRTLSLLAGLILLASTPAGALEVIKVKKATPTVVHQDDAKDNDTDPKADKTKTTPEERGLEGPPHDDNADAPAWGWGKDKKPKPTPVPTRPRLTPIPTTISRIPYTPTPNSSLPTPHFTPVTILKPVTIVEVMTPDTKPVTVFVVVTTTPVPSSPVTISKPVTVQVVVTATPVRRTRVVYRRVPAPRRTPTPAPRVRTGTTGTSVGFPCGVGWVWDLGFSVGADKRNDSLRQMWSRWVPEGVDWGGDRANMALETALMLRLSWFHIGAFYNWHFWSIGSSMHSTLTEYPTDYELNLSSISYGVKMRFKHCDFPLLLDLTAGELRLFNANYMATDAMGKVFDLSLKGSAPLGRVDLGWDFVPRDDLDVILTIGYQRALMETLTYRLDTYRIIPAMEGMNGTLTNFADGKNVRADFSGPRAGLTFSLRF